MPVATRSRPSSKTSRESRSRRSTDVLALLKNDHREVNEMFEKVEDLGERASAQRGKLGEQICKALELHSTFEQSVLYPQIRERAEDHEEREQILEALEEHGVVDRLVGELNGMDAKVERFEAKLTVLIEAVRHHVKEEERELFPTAKELLEKDELDEMGERFIEEKRRAGMPIA